MPDWVVNELTVTGEKDAIDAFRARAAASTSGNPTDVSPDFLLDRFFPTPSDLAPEQQAAWRTESWGVDSDAVDTLADTDGGALVYTFETAWRPPLPFLRRVSQEEPKLRFQLDYRGEMSCWDETAVFVRGAQIS